MPHEPLAVLISGGLDSAIVLGDALRHGHAVQPLCVRCGLFWEPVEHEFLQRFLSAIAAPNLAPLVVLQEPVADVYGPHWSVTGRDVPAADSPDDAVFLPGRNILLLGKALLWCHLHGVGALALGSLPTNPFPDATVQFFRMFQELVDTAVGSHVEVRLPLAGMTKRDVMRLGRELPLGLTFSCLRPDAGRHCGRCNKCAERRRAFADAALADPTVYAETE